MSPIQVPSSFSVIAQSPETIMVVTQSSSVLMEALLHCLAGKSGLSQVVQVQAGTQLTSRQPGTLYWCNLNEEAALAQISPALDKLSFATLSLFKGRGPVKSNPRYSMSFAYLLIALTGLTLKSRYCVLLFGKPLEVPPPALKNKTKLSRLLKLDFFQSLKLVRGTPFQPLETQARVVLGGREFEREISILAKRYEKPVDELRERAAKEFYSMAAAPNGTILAIADLLARLLLGRLFNSVLAKGLENFRAASRQHPVVLIPMHRSHLDYVLVSSKLYEANMIPPLVAAGVNLNFWPLGRLFRGAGAFFLKREASQDYIHGLILQRYVSYLIKRGHLQEFFIEGGRSRSGRMLSPKHGLLNILVSAFNKGARKEILFVPVSISYENVIEDRSYGEENIGKPKKKENFLQLLKARKIFRKKYGEVIVNFGSPISLASFVAEYRKQSCLPDADKKTLVVQLGDYIKQRITDEINVSLTSLIYSSLLMAPNYGLKQETLLMVVKNLARLATLLKSYNPRIGEFTPSLTLFLEGHEQLLSDIARGGVVEIQKAFGTGVFFIPAENRIIADFYKNSSIHLFYTISLMSVLQLLGRDISEAETADLHELLGGDILPLRKEEAQNQLRGVRDLLIRDGLLGVASGKTQFVDFAPGIFMPGLVLAPAESLLWVCYNLVSGAGIAFDPADFTSEGALKVFLYQDFIKKLQLDFDAAYHLGFLRRTESASKSTLMGALDCLRQRKIVSIFQAGQSKKILLRRDLAPELTRLLEITQAIHNWLQTTGETLSGDQTSLSLAPARAN